MIVQVLPLPTQHPTPITTGSRQNPLQLPTFPPPTSPSPIEK